MRLIPAKKLLIFLIVFGIITFLFFILAICPLFEEIKESSEDFVSTKKNLAALEMKTKNSIALKELYSSQQQNLKKVDALLVDSEVPIEFVNFLKEAADDSQLFIEISFAPSGVELQRSLWFNLSLTGSFLNTARFLFKIENAPYLVKIQSFEIQKENPKGQIIKSSLSIEVFTK